MLLPLFRADLFSESVPRFVVPPASIARRAQEILHRAYGRKVGRVKSIEQHGGNEVNSNNFRITSSAGRFLLKRVLRADIVPALDRQLRLMGGWVVAAFRSRLPSSATRVN